MNSLRFYCEKFSKLKVSNSRKRGNAQYKPILLLTVIDLIMRGVIINNQIFVSDELIQSFNTYLLSFQSRKFEAPQHLN